MVRPPRRQEGLLGALPPAPPLMGRLGPCALRAPGPAPAATHAPRASRRPRLPPGRRSQAAYAAQVATQPSCYAARRMNSYVNYRMNFCVKCRMNFCVKCRMNSYVRCRMNSYVKCRSKYQSKRRPPEGGRHLQRCNSLHKAAQGAAFVSFALPHPGAGR